MSLLILIFEFFKIGLFSIGGVGGYLGAMLAHAYPHVTLAARGKRLEHIKEHGLTLHSVYSGEITAFPEHVTTADAIGPQDYIFVCVKNYSLEDVCRQITPFVDDHTVLIPVMNGVDTGERMRKALLSTPLFISLPTHPRTFPLPRSATWLPCGSA